jgi:uncharacterized membrane protein YgcG
MKRLPIYLVIFALAGIAYAGEDRGPRRFRGADEFLIAHGPVVLRTIDDHTAVIVFDDTDDSATRHVFRFWSEDRLAPINSALRAASVEYRGTELVIMSADEPLLFVFTVDASMPPLKFPAAFTTSRIVGYGLNHRMKSVPAGPADRAKTNDEIDCMDSGCVYSPDFVSEEGGSSGGCNSGGIGSSSCSITSGGGGSCSVSCSSGYYSCCKRQNWPSNPQECKCIRY